MWAQDLRGRPLRATVLGVHLGDLAQFVQVERCLIAGWDRLQEFVSAGPRWTHERCRSTTSKGEADRMDRYREQAVVVDDDHEPRVTGCRAREMATASPHRLE